MVLDTSALLAIALGEDERDRFIELIEADPVRLISTGSILEASMVFEVRFGAVLDLDLLGDRLGLETVPFSFEQMEAARRGWRTYGRGRHPAALNFGDCFAYGLATSTGEPLLFKGDDFRQTDVLVVAA
jgi:ribonuclease VapC